MILQNLAKAVREQNYYAVVLEFLIVIAGVVIGFQIQGWNQERQESLAFKQILLRFHTELSPNIEGFRSIDARLASLLQDADFALQTVIDGDLASEDEGRFRRGVSILLEWAPLNQSSTLFIFNDPDVLALADETPFRDSILDFTESVRSGNIWSDRIHSEAIVLRQEISRHFKFRLVFDEQSGQLPQRRMTYDFEALTGDQALVDAMAQLLNLKYLEYRATSQGLEAIDQLYEEIEAYLFPEGATTQTPESSS